MIPRICNGEDADNVLFPSQDCSVYLNKPCNTVQPLSRKHGFRASNSQKPRSMLFYMRLILTAKCEEVLKILSSC